MNPVKPDIEAPGEEGLSAEIAGEIAAARELILRLCDLVQDQEKALLAIDRERRESEKVVVAVLMQYAPEVLPILLEAFEARKGQVQLEAGGCAPGRSPGPTSRPVPAVLFLDGVSTLH